MATLHRHCHGSTSTALNHLINLFKAPNKALSYDPAQWAAVLAAAQKNQLMGQLGARIGAVTGLGKLPQAVQRHLTLATLTSSRRSNAALWEVEVIRHAVPESIPIVLLKGVAYSAAKDMNAVGRIFSDIDILVPRQCLDETEASLFSHGWQLSKVDEYDRKYYREWMHELPPMTHVRRQTVVDLHHAIVPVISQYSFATERLFQDAVELAPNLFVLSPTDRIIHCAIHALIEGEPSKLLRELYDLSALLEQHAGQSSDNSRILERARQLGLERLVVPPIQAAEFVFGAKPELPDGRIARWLIQVAMGGQDDSSGRGRVARLGLLAHSHRLKMPIGILIPHLIRKATKAKGSSGSK